MGSINENSDTDVKAEKANAMRRYSMKRNITYYIRFTFPLLLLSVFLNYYPILSQAKTILCFLKSHLFMFLVVNSIVVVVLLSKSSSSSSTSRIEYVGFSYQPDHVYEEYVAMSRDRFGENTVVLVADKDHEEEEEDEEGSGTVDHEEKKMEIMVVAAEAGEVVDEKNSHEPISEEVNMVVVNARPADVVNNYDHLNYYYSSSSSTTNNNNNSNKHSHRRSRSEMWRRETEDVRLMKKSEGGGDNRLRELRRSESTKNGNGGWSSSTDPTELGRMNNEEFRLTIENFIATRKKLMLRDQTLSISSSSSSPSNNNNNPLFHSTTTNDIHFFL